jgi:hypothetical protein
VSMARERCVGKSEGCFSRLPLLKCECGAEILLLPDLKVMNQAIEVHVLERRKKEKDAGKAAATAARIRKILIEHLLRKASEIGR